MPLCQVNLIFGETDYFAANAMIKQMKLRRGKRMMPTQQRRQVALGVLHAYKRRAVQASDTRVGTLARHMRVYP